MAPVPTDWAAFRGSRRGASQWWRSMLSDASASWQQKTLDPVSGSILLSTPLNLSKLSLAHLTHHALPSPTLLLSTPSSTDWVTERAAIAAIVHTTSTLKENHMLSWTLHALRRPSIANVRFSTLRPGSMLFRGSFINESKSALIIVTPPFRVRSVSE